MPETETPHRPLDTPARGRVLVVEDEQLMREALADALQLAGFDVDTAPNGRAALESAARSVPDAVLLDRHLPDVDGQQVLDGLRADPRTEHLAVLMISGDSTVDRKVEGFGSGANDYLTKPVDIRELVARLEAQITARHRWLDHLSAAMSRRRTVAEALAKLDVRAPLPELLNQLVGALQRELGATAVAVSVREDDGSLLLVGGSALSVPDGARRTSDTPWIERSTSGSWVHVPLVCGPAVEAVLSVRTGAHPEATLSSLVDLSPQLSLLLQPAVSRASHSAVDNELVERALANGGMWPVFQPIVELDGRTPVGFEGLSRFADGTRPDLAFAAAARIGRQVDLELAAVRSIIAASTQLPGHAWVSLNVSAETLLRVDLAPFIAEARCALKVEITEHELVTDYRQVTAAVERLGVGLSVDDAGSGFASLRHVYELRPSMVKLDRGWVGQIDTDPVRQALIGGLLTFTTSFGAVLVAEGVERPEELQALRELGVPLGQGYLFGRPQPTGRGGDVGG